MEQFLYHGIKNYNVDLLEKILISGYIKPRSGLEGLITDQNNIFNGTDYISLSQKSRYGGPTPEGHVRVSYEEFIYNQLCLVLKPNNINLIIPTLIDLDFLPREEWNNIKYKNGDTRYTYYQDEVQTKDNINLKNNLVAIGLPLEYLRYSYSNDQIKLMCDRLHTIMQIQGYDVPILDSSKFSFADDYDRISKNEIDSGSSKCKRKDF